MYSFRICYENKEQIVIYEIDIHIPTNDHHLKLLNVHQTQGFYRIKISISNICFSNPSRYFSLNKKLKLSMFYEMILKLIKVTFI